MCLRNLRMGFLQRGSFHSLAVALCLLITLLQRVNGNGEYRYNVSRRVPEKRSHGCNYFRGNWVFDHSYPLYDPSRCPFIEQVFDCQRNGRPDRLYLKYRWQPSGCYYPRFNGLDFLQKFKGKRIMFVGDSLSLNQWQSLTCMLHTAVPHARYTLVRVGGLSEFRFPEFEVSIMMMRNAFLVDLVTEKRGRVLKLDSINGGQMWRGIDMLIFNSWHWWTHRGRFQVWDYVQVGNRIFKDMDRLVAYKIAMRTWARWVELNVNPSKTRVIFQGISPAHYNSTDWDQAKGNCFRQQKPLPGPRYPGPTPSPLVILKTILRHIRKPVFLLDVTLLSELRIDGHPSVYASPTHRGLDCSHWCLAGVPDTWNQLLYASVIA